MLKRILSKYYTQKTEDVCVRILYFFNCIDTYFLVAGILSFHLYFLFYSLGTYDIVAFGFVTLMVWFVFKIADFYPLFLVFSPVYLLFLFKASSVVLSGVAIATLTFLNLIVFLVIQFSFMSVPESIVARDITIGIRKIWNSIFTIAPTTVSLPMSVCFSTLYALALVAKPNPLQTNGFLFWLAMLGAAVVTHIFKPKSFRSPDVKPAQRGKLCERVILLNIDGCRLDRFYEAKLSFLTSLQKKSTYFPNGIQTVYRALTNPAFASILTGAIPEIHRVKNNNLGQRIKVEALPDVVKTRLYGTMHTKHFSKPHWDTRIVSMPTHGAYKTDDVMFEWLKEDLAKHDDIHLFIADISEVDFLGHAYGSESRRYLEALKGTDRRMEQFFEWLKENNMSDDTIAIITSDHGIIRIDHSYLLFKAERYVPFIITGSRIKANNPLQFEASIMDVAPTISYLLGAKYPASCRGRVFTEAIA